MVLTWHFRRENAAIKQETEHILHSLAWTPDVGKTWCVNPENRGKGKFLKGPTKIFRCPAFQKIMEPPTLCNSYSKQQITYIRYNIRRLYQDFQDFLVPKFQIRFWKLTFCGYVSPRFASALTILPSLPTGEPSSRMGLVWKTRGCHLHRCS